MIWLFACTTSAIQEQNSIIDQTQSPPEDTAFVVELEEEEIISAELIEATLQEGIEKIREIRAHRALDAYENLLAEGDESCPRWYVGENGPYWADECVASSGVTFQGYGLSWEHEALTDEWGNTWTGRQLHCEGSLESTETKLSCLGGFNELVGTDANDSPVFYSYTSPYTLEENDLETTYPQMEMWAVNNSWGKAIHYSGTISVSSGIVQFDETALNNVDCTREPEGKQNVQVSAESSSWINLIWHGEEGAASSACDGCAEAFMNGKNIGLICADFSTWLMWNESPFE